MVAMFGMLLFIPRVVVTAEALDSQPPAVDVQIVHTKALNKGACLTRKRIASVILKNMDLKVEPCDNFYRFACGGFLNSTVIPDGAGKVSTFSTLQYKVQQQLRASMEEPSNPNELKPFRLVKNLYKSCMNTTAIEDQGLEPLYKILKKLGGWPVLEGRKWNEANFDWISSNYKFRETGYSVDYFFRLRVKVDSQNRTRRVISLEPADLGLNYKHLSEGVNNEQVKAYYNYMVDIAVLLGAERKCASTELMESLLFEINLANISQSIEEQIHASLSYKPMALDQLTNNYSSIPWREYFNKLLPKNITVAENEVVIVNMPSFFSDLEKLLYKTPKRVQANYVIWRAVNDSVKYLNDDIRKIQHAFLTTLNSKSTRTSRWQECVDLVSLRLPVGVDAMYVMKYFSKVAKQNVVDMVRNIKKQFKKILRQAKWMDDITRSMALKQAAVASHVGYLDKLVKDTRLAKLYDNLELSGGNFLYSNLNSTVFNVDHSFGELRKRVKMIDMIKKTRPTEVGAYYKPYGNGIHFSAGLLQCPVFSSEQPRYMNYGRVGLVIGHEIVHGFMSHLLTVDGNHSDWKMTKKNYRKKTECMIKQYDNYTVKEAELQINGSKTKHENIADNAGIKIAYLAYINWAKKHETERKLPGLPYSPNQMFWISAATQWCAKFTREQLKHHIKTNSHSPNEFRTIGAMSNMPEFSKDFDCLIGSNMNPKKKCSVW